MICHITRPTHYAGETMICHLMAMYEKLTITGSKCHSMHKASYIGNCGREQMAWREKE